MLRMGFFKKVSHSEEKETVNSESLDQDIRQLMDSKSQKSSQKSWLSKAYRL